MRLSLEKKKKKKKKKKKNIGLKGQSKPLSLRNTYTHRTTYKTLVTLSKRFQLLTLTILINMINTYKASNNA